jgi:hypothetical protein
MVAQDCIPIYLGGGDQEDAHSRPAGGQWLSIAFLLSQESTNRRITVHASPSIKQDPISKTTKAKRTGGMTQVVEYFLSKCEALRSTPSITHTYTKIH